MQPQVLGLGPSVLGLGPSLLRQVLGFGRSVLGLALSFQQVLVSWRGPFLLAVAGVGLSLEVLGLKPSLVEVLGLKPSLYEVLRLGPSLLPGWPSVLPGAPSLLEGLQYLAPLLIPRLHHFRRLLSPLDVEDDAVALHDPGARTRVVFRLQVCGRSPSILRLWLPSRHPPVRSRHLRQSA